MRVIDIEFVKLVGIKQSQNELSLAYKKDVLNHIQTIHASAQFTLAETASGLCLKESFPDILDVVPLLRDSSIKYKKPALKEIVAFATISDEDKESFLKQFKRKSRATINVSVEIKDSDGVCTAEGIFRWFISKI